MKSYAVIDRMEDGYAILEVELHDIEESKTLSASEKRTQIVHVGLNTFPKTDETFGEGDVVLVEHECGFVVSVYGKDEEEKQRRIERIRKIRETFKYNN